MKTPVSIPDNVLKRAERLARSTKRSRNRLFTDALKEYLSRHTPEKMTEAMNRACFEIGKQDDAFARTVSHRILEHTEW